MPYYDDAKPVVREVSFRSKLSLFSFPIIRHARQSKKAYSQIVRVSVPKERRGRISTNQTIGLSSAQAPFTRIIEADDYGTVSITSNSTPVTQVLEQTLIATSALIHDSGE
jgi:hypothetical protein